jgi:hypothetical protein
MVGAKSLVPKLSMADQNVAKWEGALPLSAFLARASHNGGHIGGHLKIPYG